MNNWLPELLEMENYNDDWAIYFDAVYAIFKKDFVDNRATFQGKPLGLKKYPEYQGKSATFWHMISEGSEETERTPDIRRCERIAWPRPIIENWEKNEIYCWKNKRGNDTRILL